MQRVNDQISKILKEVTKIDIYPEDIIESPIADLASPVAFKIAKNLKKNPKEVAEEIAKKIKPRGFVEKVVATNGYLNFFINYGEFSKQMLTDIKSEKEYGKSQRKNKKIILEHTSVNPSGPLHVGRLRNSLIGDSLRRILIFSGYDVETHYYVNDIGKQIAIIAQGFRENIKPDEKLMEEYSEYKNKQDFKVFFEYVASNKKFEEDEEFSKRVQELIKKAESGDKKSLDEITSVARKCLDGQKEIFKKLDIKFDSFYFESKYVENTAVDDVLNFLERSMYWKDTEFGSGLDLGEFGLGRRGNITVLSRSDGTSVYLTRDIAYHLEKIQIGDEIINVLGEDHKFEFQELSTILKEIYKIKKSLRVVHFSFVNFEGTELSTRKGQIASVDKLIDVAISKAAEEIKKREIASSDIADIIGIGAIKYHIIKTAPNKQITFKWDLALSFDGDAAPYIQYAYARSCRILEKSKLKVDDIDIEKIDLNLENDEKELVKNLSEFSDIVKKASAELRPDLIATYLYKLASSYNRFYKNCQVLDVSEKVMMRRLLLVDSTKNIIKTGLYLIGIESPERM